MKSKSKDKYDQAIQYLTANPNEVYRAWNSPRNHHEAGCLFKMVGDGTFVGCLTQIAMGEAEAATRELTTLIRSEQRLAIDVIQIEGSGGAKEVSRKLLPLLPLFAKYQRVVDKKLNLK